ncbi:helix-turn-helix transcriptional regulator [Stutzerimonas nitrititolerans]|uniref:helix-turn-helix transcriptional regulator n=1 Tax=Stutzerimonas nitrititolerans TaxID=2482751 RepID=UPI00289D7951|nr:WYL domain-containing protein [Stutzerimonas nitrititolerans]
MPASSSRSTLARQWELLKMLPVRAPGTTAADLQKSLEQAGHPTSKRTVERDLVELSRLFPLQCNSKGTPFGWYWTPGSAAELPGLSICDALTMRLVEGSIRPLVPANLLGVLEPKFAQAQRKLESLSAESASARWAEKVASVQPALSLLAPEIDTDVLEKVQNALLNDLQVRCRYYAAHKDQTHDLTLSPLALVQRGQVTYLIAIAEPFEDVRQFVLHRIQAAVAIDRPANRPADFDLQRYIASGTMQFGSGASIKLEAWISDGLARLIRETPISHDMQISPLPDGAMLSATVPDSWELRWWILSHAGSIRIDRPTNLRKAIRQRLMTALNLFNGEKE